MSSATSQFVKVSNGWGFQADNCAGELIVVLDPDRFTPRAMQRLVHAYAGPYRSVVLDLASYTSIDSVALGHLLDLRRCYQARGVERFVMINVSQRVAELLHLLRVDTCFQLRAA